MHFAFKKRVFYKNPAGLGGQIWWEPPEILVKGYFSGETETYLGGIFETYVHTCNQYIWVAPPGLIPIPLKENWGKGSKWLLRVHVQ